MSNSAKVIEENNKHFGFESALFIPEKEKFDNKQEEKFDDFNDLFNYKSKFESSNNLEPNEAQKRNSLGIMNIHSLLSHDLMKKIEDCSPMKSAEAQKFGFMELKISPKVLFNKPEAQSFNPNEEQNYNFLEDALQGKISKDNIQKFNSCFMQNPFFSKASEETKSSELAKLINETEQINYDKFDSNEFQNFNSIQKEDNIKNINEEILFSKLLESLNINNESNLEASDIMVSSDFEKNPDLNVNLNNTTKKGNDLNSNFINVNDFDEKIIGDSDKNNKQLSSTLLQNININNNFNYNIGNSLPHLHYYNYLMSLNPYLLNASLIFKLNYLQKLQNFLINSNKNNKIKSSNYQFGKAGWTCLYCNNFNYEIRIKCNRCGKLPQNKKDAKAKEEVNPDNNDNISFNHQKTNLFTDEKKGIDNKNLFFQNKAKNNDFDNKSANDILSNINVNTRGFIPSSYKDVNIINNSTKSTNLVESDSKKFNYPNYPNNNQNQNSRSFVNNTNIPNSFIAQNDLQIKYDKINKFNEKTDCPENGSLASKENRNLYGYNSNSKMFELSKNNNFCPTDKNKFYSNAIMQNQFLYNQNTPINKFNTCNGIYSNPLKNGEIESNYSNIRKSSVMESQRATQIDNNKFNLSENPATQLNPMVNSSSNPIDLQAEKKKKKPFVERIGDWVCLRCKNLNFSFRLACNRCQLTKVENEKLSEGTVKKSI